MTRTTYYTATSLDGFIATAENSLDWLLKQDIDEEGPLNYTSFIAGIGAMAMGSTTYEWVVDHTRGTDRPWEYEIPCWVFTHRDLEPVGDDIHFTQAPVAEVHAEMAAAAGDRGIWVVGGGDLAGQFADEGLLDEIITYTAPVTLGSGAPLLPRALDLELVEAARNRGFACARYEVIRPDA